jgi:hypothetical protein
MVRPVFVILIPLFYSPLVWTVFNFIVQLAGSTWLLLGLLVLAMRPLGTGVLGALVGIEAPMEPERFKRVHVLLKLWGMGSLAASASLLLHAIFNSGELAAESSLIGAAIAAALAPRAIIVLSVSTAAQLLRTSVAAADYMAGRLAAQRAFEVRLESGTTSHNVADLTDVLRRGVSEAVGPVAGGGEADGPVVSGAVRPASPPTSSIGGGSDRAIASAAHALNSLFAAHGRLDVVKQIVAKRNEALDDLRRVASPPLSITPAPVLHRRLSRALTRRMGKRAGGAAAAPSPTTPPTTPPATPLARSSSMSALLASQRNFSFRTKVSAGCGGTISATTSATAVDTPFGDGETHTDGGGDGGGTGSWHAAVDADGQTYYWNTRTRVSQYEMPAGCNGDAHL